MSWPPAPPRGPAPWWMTIRAMFTSDRTITSEGVGANLVEMLGELTRAIDGCTAEIARFNNWADKHGPQAPDDS